MKFIKKHKFLDIYKRRIGIEDYTVVAPFHKRIAAQDEDSFVKRFNDELSKNIIEDGFSRVESCELFIDQFILKLKDSDKFENLLTTLTNDEKLNIKINVQYNQEHKYLFAYGENDYIKLGFCSKNNSPSTLNDKLCVDFKEEFGKWRDCPLNLEIPDSPEALNVLNMAIYTLFYTKYPREFFHYIKSPINSYEQLIKTIVKITEWSQTNE